jgi:hypothetical protein
LGVANRFFSRKRERGWGGWGGGGAKQMIQISKTHTL